MNWLPPISPRSEAASSAQWCAPNPRFEPLNLETRTRRCFWLSFARSPTHASSLTAQV